MFNEFDKIILTLFNEPSLGLFYTQKHIQDNLPNLLFNMDKLYENRKLASNTLQDMKNTEKEVKEISGLNDSFTLNMLNMINSINCEIGKKK